jgi:hypothetical protein
MRHGDALDSSKDSGKLTKKHGKLLIHGADEEGSEKHRSVLFFLFCVVEESEGQKSGEWGVRCTTIVIQDSDKRAKQQKERGGKAANKQTSNTVS